MENIFKTLIRKVMERHCSMNLINFELAKH